MNRGTTIPSMTRAALVAAALAAAAARPGQARLGRGFALPGHRTASAAGQPERTE